MKSHIFNEKEINIDPYWLGLWLGDGTSAKPAITVGNKDKEIESFLYWLAEHNELFVRREGEKKRQGSIVLNFSPRQGSGFAINNVLINLQKMNLINNKHIPETYMINSSYNRLQILAGLIDSDGTKNKSGSIIFSNTNKRLAMDVLFLARSLGFRTTFREKTKGIKKRNYKCTCYDVCIGGNLSRIPVKLPRKIGHDNIQKTSLRHSIKVNSIGNGEYFGFTLDGDKQFLLGDFTVTHNSAFPVHLAGLLEFDVWDFNINECHSKWVGEGSEKMRETLKKLTKSSHLIVRIDEYDRAMGSTGESGGGMHEAHKQVESEFMNWLQNSQEENVFVKQNIFIVMTTNHKENITGPMLRSGRADLVIDIDNFDTKSMKEAFVSAARRMTNRGFKVVGFKNQKLLEEAINKLNLDKLAETAMVKGFTVRDVDVFISEMSAHYYYFKKGNDGFDWTTENFMKVLSKSQGSIKDTTTGELVLGDRFANEVEENNSEQLKYPFNKNSVKDKSEIPDLDNVSGFDIDENI